MSNLHADVRSRCGRRGSTNLFIVIALTIASVAVAFGVSLLLFTGRSSEEPVPKVVLKNDATPSIENAQWSYGTKMGARNPIAGFDIEVSIANPLPRSLESVELIAQIRQSDRDVPQGKTVIGGPVRGGIQAGSTEVINVFLPKSVAEMADFDDLPKEWKIELSIAGFRELGSVDVKLDHASFVSAKIKENEVQIKNPGNIRNPLEFAIQEAGANQPK